MRARPNRRVQATPLTPTHRRKLVWCALALACRRRIEICVSRKLQADGNSARPVPAPSHHHPSARPEAAVRSMTLSIRAWLPRVGRVRFFSKTSGSSRFVFVERVEQADPPRRGRDQSRSMPSGTAALRRAEGRASSRRPLRRPAHCGRRGPTTGRVVVASCWSLGQSAVNVVCVVRVLEKDRGRCVSGRLRTGRDGRATAAGEQAAELPEPGFRRGDGGQMRPMRRASSSCRGVKLQGIIGSCFVCAAR